MVNSVSFWMTFVSVICIETLQTATLDIVSFPHQHYNMHLFQSFCVKCALKVAKICQKYGSISGSLPNDGTRLLLNDPRIILCIMIIQAAPSKKGVLNIRKKRKFRSILRMRKVSSGRCGPLKYSTVSTDSACGQWMYNQTCSRSRISLCIRSHFYTWRGPYCRQ